MNRPPRKPDWLKVRFPAGSNFARIDRYHRRQGLHSVCRSAACPNQGECWNRGTATFMILGDHCTRDCRFCNVTGVPPLPVDPEEPARVAAAIAELKLRHAVITSVTRDDLADGGASAFAAVTREIRNRLPDCRIELLIPDLAGNHDALQVILDSRPDILGHNLETVPRLYPTVRAGADYRRSLELLRQAAERAPGIPTKSGLMLGLGEQRSELLQVMRDLRQAGCGRLTLGQYLQPTRTHQPVARYLPPEEFAELKAIGLRLGFEHVASGPLVRSSYQAEEQHLEAEHGHQ
ncbi:lipoic acid synthetase [Geothermobacter ehrlichii]|uniref:Lipoyl synthase n=1 Tax=Geothermobacter ehrlichii TaxID=213224 RepID=A0A5D3WJL5_9BACT|nr:lipoyl synthase [Geothermobacter ehrlichii]TYO98491.1 lipoic acid synthetase [Geothermobacter ehrlichii]